MKDPYYNRSEVSNSDLSWIKKYWQMQDEIIDAEKAYRFGTLLDCMITEPQKVNHYKLTCAGQFYTNAEFELAEQMKRSFYRDQLASHLARNSDFQKVSVRKDFPIHHRGVDFTLNVRCKWDLYAHHRVRLSGDIKSTTATTQKQFVDACDYFDYFRQRAWYMDIEGHEKDVIIGVSKVNLQVFKVAISKGDAYYQKGKAQYEQLAFRWWQMFGEDKNFLTNH